MKKHYTLGRGKLYFDAYAPGTINLTGERYLGNSPAVSFTVDAESLLHFGSDRNIARKRDAFVQFEPRRTIDFTLDSGSLENLALWFNGGKQVYEQAAATDLVQVIRSVLPGHEYQIGDRVSGARCVTNVRAVADVVRDAVDLVVILDCSGSMFPDRMAAVRDGLPAALRDLLGPQDRSALVTWGGGNAFLNQALTENHDATATAVEGVVASLGNTQPQFGIALATTHLTSNVRPGVQQFIIHVCDTSDFSGTAYVTEATNAKNAGILFYGLGIGITGDAPAISRLDSQVSPPTSKYRYLADTPSEISGSFALIINDLLPVIPPYAPGQDFIVDEHLGRFELTENTAIPPGSDVEITYDLLACEWPVVISPSNVPQIEGALRFISNNPAGPERSLYMPRVTLSPTGDFPLKGDEWQAISFTADVWKRDAFTEAFYADGATVPPP